jgi:glycosidase
MKILLIILLVGVAAAAQAQHYPSPTDWRNENIYQILTDRFYDGNPSNNNVEASHGSPYSPTTNNGINGGDFRGIQDKLDYIKSLGASAIWISPIVFNVGGTSAYHGYGAQDFYQLAPHWGTMTDLSNMVQAAHARGIKVILDIVCNHTGDLIGSSDSGYPTYKAPPAGYHMSYYNTANEHAFPFNPTNFSPTADLSAIFHTNGQISSFNYPTDTQQDVLGELDGLDDLRTETSYVRTNLMNIYTNWVGIADFDGFRVDTAIEVDYGFWQYWCPQLHQAAMSMGKSNFFIYGEAFSGNEQQVGSYTGTEGGGPFKFDAMLDYGLFEGSINSVFATASGNPGQISAHYSYFPTYYDSNSWYRMVTFLDNHDNARFLSSGNANGNTNRLTVALQFLYTSRGVPSLYYGTEQGFEGDNNNNDNREDMFAGGWQPQVPVAGDNFNETQPLFQQVARLNNFRRLYPAVCTGVQNVLYANTSGPGLFAYSRVLSNEELFICFNTASSSQALTNCPTTYAPGTVLVNLLNTNDTITVISGAGTNETPAITVPSTTAKIYIGQSLVLPLDPVVTNQVPSHAATNISIATPVVLRFSEPMNTNSVEAAFSVTPATCMCTNSGSLVICSAQASPTTTPVAGTFTWDALQDTMTFTPSGGWTPATTNLVHLSTNAVDGVSGNSFYGAFDTYFVTSTNAVADLTPPTVAINSPTNGATVVGTISISGTASDNVAVASVQISIDSGSWMTASGTTSWSFSLNTQYMLNGLHTIYAQATDTSGNVSTIPSVTVNVFNVPGAYLTRISPGDPYTVTDCSANVWLKDQTYSFNSFGYTGSSATGYVNNAITGICTNAYRLYQWERYSSGGSFSYIFNCPEGLYQIQLLEAETYWSSTNQREFNLFIQGQQVLTNFDIFKAAGGQNIPITLVFTAIVNNAQLDMNFVPGAADNARASGIQVLKIGDLDTDGDGIPDWWMLGYFNHATGQSNDNSLASDDADGSGFSNLQDYLAGMNPLDPSTAFRITNIIITNNTDVQVTWTTEPNKTNQLQSSSAPGTNGTWNSVGSITLGTGLPATQTDYGAATNNPLLFYRVWLVP